MKPPTLNIRYLSIHIGTVDQCKVGHDGDPHRLECVTGGEVLEDDLEGVTICMEGSRGHEWTPV